MLDADSCTIFSCRFLKEKLDYSCFRFFLNTRQLTQVFNTKKVRYLAHRDNVTGYLASGRGFESRGQLQLCFISFRHCATFLKYYISPKYNLFQFLIFLAMEMSFAS